MSCILSLTVFILLLGSTGWALDLYCPYKNHVHSVKKRGIVLDRICISNQRASDKRELFYHPFHCWPCAAGDISPLCSLPNNNLSVKLGLHAGCAVWVQEPLDSWIKAEFHQSAFPPVRLVPLNNNNPLSRPAVEQ